jgi:predicted nucleotidyltransferase
LDSVKIISSPDAEIEPFLESYAAFLRRRGASHAYIFGSRSRGDYSPYSDIDVLIEVPSSNLPRRDRAAQFLPAAAPVSVDVFVFTGDEMRTSRFAARALEHARRLF